MYLEDDLVIHDPSSSTNNTVSKNKHRFTLMPHCYERVNQKKIHHLLVDGAINPQFLGKFMQPRLNAASGVYKGREIVNFDLASNPILDASW